MITSKDCYHSIHRKSALPRPKQSIERHRTSKSSERGFTFIEIVIALALLATATSIFIGLQAAAVQRSIHDRNVQQAMLAARRIMAVVDGNPSKLEVGDQDNVPVADLLSTLGAPESKDEDEKAALSLLHATLKIEDWTIPVPKIEEKSMRRLTLWVAWGPDPDERFELMYFIPVVEEQTE